MPEEIEVQDVNAKYIPTERLPKSQRHRPLSSNVWIHNHDLPSGRLCLRASSSDPRATWEKQWREAKKGELSSMVPQIVLDLEAAAPVVARLVEKGQRQLEIQRREWEVQEERWRRDEAERRRVQNVKESREQLISLVEAWVVAKQIEGFFEDAERRAAALGDADREELIDRLHRARSLLGGIDAVQRFLAWRAPEER